jgi:hypothetical protein
MQMDLKQHSLIKDHSLQIGVCSNTVTHTCEKCSTKYEIELDFDDEDKYERFEIWRKIYGRKGNHNLCYNCDI